MKDKINVKKKNTDLGIEKYNSLGKKPILFVDSLTKKYPGKKVAAIQDLNFNIYPGQFHAFIGGNGAGKTTTIKSIIGAYSKWSGTILINGVKNTKEAARSKLGYIPETARFPDRMSAFEYLVWMARLSGKTKSEAVDFSERKLKELSMWNLRKKSPNTFSSGQKKKILLAQALVNEPDLLIMDEPTANLDPRARTEFYDTLKGLISKNKSVFVSSHILTELDRHATSATILDGGKIIYSGSIKKLIKKYTEIKYTIKTNNNSAVLKHLEKNEFIKIFYDDFYDRVEVTFPKEKDKQEFVSWCNENKINILSLSLYEPVLDDIYEKMVNFGSVDNDKK